MQSETILILPHSLRKKISNRSPSLVDWINTNFVFVSEPYELGCRGLSFDLSQKLFYFVIRGFSIDFRLYFIAEQK